MRIRLGLEMVIKNSPLLCFLVRSRFDGFLTLGGGLKRFSSFPAFMFNNSSFVVFPPVNIFCCFDVLLNISSCSFLVLFAAKWFCSLTSGRGGEGVSGSKGEISAIFITLGWKCRKFVKLGLGTLEKSNQLKFLQIEECWKTHFDYCDILRGKNSELNWKWRTNLKKKLHKSNVNVNFALL